MHNVTVFPKEILFCGFPTYRQAGVRSVRQAKKEFHRKNSLFRHTLNSPATPRQQKKSRNP